LLSATSDRRHRRGTLDGDRVISYAVGLAHGVYRGHATVGHGGADAGYRAEFLRFPEQALSVAVLCNFPSSDPDRLARAVADAYLEPGSDEDASVVASSPSATSDDPGDGSDIPPPVPDET